MTEHFQCTGETVRGSIRTMPKERAMPTPRKALLLSQINCPKSCLRVAPTLRLFRVARATDDGRETRGKLRWKVGESCGKIYKNSHCFLEKVVRQYLC